VYRGFWGLFNNILIEMVYPFLLRKADKVFVQHEGQKNILLRRDIKSEIFKNIISSSQIPVSNGHERKNFIYVGELTMRKGFDDFFELVNKVPFHFISVVGQPHDKRSRHFYEKLKSYGNVSLLGRLNHSDTMKLIAKSKALISTSPMEGFPNVFIEAWACGVPVISLYFDPGGIIENDNLGHIAHGDLNRMVDAMNNIISGGDFAERARAYVENNYMLNPNKIKEISKMITEI
jgi:glycosyltransferase involved in cell wall biosynthesis